MDSSQFREIETEFCHLTLHLPVRTDEHKLAANEIIDELKNENRGSTYIDVEKTDFTGTWLNEYASLVEEEVTIFMVDLPYDYLKQRDEIIATMRAIKKRAFEFYENNGVPQDEIWLTSSPMTILRRVVLHS